MDMKTPNDPDVPASEQTPAVAIAEPEISLVDRVLGMTSELQTMREQAISDLRNQRRMIDEKLAMLGDAVAKRSPAGGTPSAIAHCRICDVDGHDARQHRFQGSAKKKFTPSELATIGNK